VARLDCELAGRKVGSMDPMPKERAPDESDSDSDSDSTEGIDIELLNDSLTRTPLERMRANDDALNFAETLRIAMEKRNAKS